MVGQSPFEIRSLWERMYRMTMVYGRRGAVIHAISAIDMALWDILGKVCGQPVYQLLGGSARTSVPAYASTLSPDTPEAAVREAQELVDQGFGAIKFGWGGLGANLDRDLNFVSRMRETVGDRVDLMIDVGMPMHFRDAAKLAMGLAEFNVFFLEEPLSADDLAGYRRLKALSPTAIACGEKENTRSAKYVPP